MLSLKVQRRKQHLAPSTTRSVRHGLCTTTGAVLMAGLLGCNPASSDPIGHTNPSAPSKQATSVTSSPQGHVLETHGHTTDERPQPQASPDVVRPVSTDTNLATTARQQWQTEARVHPDATVRREALETWAAQPSQDLDPVTYALVDEDESVRTRAQELYEQQLAREAVTVQSTVPGNAEPPTRHPE